MLYLKYSFCRPLEFCRTTPPPPPIDAPVVRLQYQGVHLEPITQVTRCSHQPARQRTSAWNQATTATYHIPSSLLSSHPSIRIYEIISSRQGSRINQIPLCLFKPERQLYPLGLEQYEVREADCPSQHWRTQAGCSSNIPQALTHSQLTLYRSPSEANSSSVSQ
jgi:hypothetical protein